MEWLIGFLAGFASGIALMILIIILGIKKVDKMHEELENLDEE